MYDGMSYRDLTLEWRICMQVALAFLIGDREEKDLQLQS